MACIATSEGKERPEPPISYNWYWAIPMLPLPAVVLFTWENVEAVALKWLCKLWCTFPRVPIHFAATNRSGGIIAFAQFGSPPKMMQKVTSQNYPQLNFQKSWSWLSGSHMCGLGTRCYFAVCCGRDAQEDIERAAFPYVGWLFLKGKNMYDQNLSPQFWGMMQKEHIQRDERHMSSGRLWERTWGNYWLEKLVCLCRDQRGKTESIALTIF